MSDARTRRRMLRRVGAVLGGVLTVVVLDTGLDALMHASGIFPPAGQPMRNALFVLATAYRAIDGESRSATSFLPRLH